MQNQAPTVAVELSAEDHAGKRREAERVGRVVEASGRRYAIVSRAWWRGESATPKPPNRQTAKPKPAPPGPGHQLKRLIAGRFNLEGTSGCGCNGMAAQMDRWGVDGCRKHREQIIAHLMDQTDQLPKAKRWALKIPGGKALARREAERMLDEALVRASEDEGASTNQAA